MNDSLDDLTTELERTAADLRRGDLDSAGAAELVERCARLAADAAAELERLARADEGARGIVPGQGELI